jgi:carboxymethylenebutenolidase
LGNDESGSLLEWLAEDSKFTIARGRGLPALEDGLIQYKAKGTLAEAYISNPKGGRPLGQVIVVHEVWGFTQFIQDACKRLSRQGFRAVAPILYWRQKELFSADKIREGMKVVWHLSLEERYQHAKLEAALKKGRASSEAASMLRTLYSQPFRSQLLRDLRFLAGSLRKEHPDLRMGAIGFSLGGGLALQLAGKSPDLAACVTYSAKPVLGPTVGKIRSPLLLLYGSEDRFMLRGLPAFVKQLVDSGKGFELKIYPAAGHEFFDHTHKRDFRAAAAEDAWETSAGFLRRNLSVDLDRDPARGTNREKKT